MAKKLDETDILLKNIITVIQDAKGKEIKCLDLKEIETSICRYFVICTGTSSTHVNSIESKIKVSQDLGKPLGTEGSNIGDWVLMDYHNIIVHIFQEKTQQHIEDLWGDAIFKN